MMRTFTSAESIDASELAGMATIAGNFYDLLATVRPELGKIPLAQRKDTRAHSVVDAAVMMHGYAYLMRDFNVELAKLGPTAATEKWQLRLSALGKNKLYQMDSWRGDFFDKRNPLWLEVGVTRVSSEKVTVLNTGAARIQAGRVLRQFLQLSSPVSDISFLAKR
jgi:hypothetical protein